MCSSNLIDHLVVFHKEAINEQSKIVVCIFLTSHRYMFWLCVLASSITFLFLTITPPSSPSLMLRVRVKLINEYVKPYLPLDIYIYLKLISLCLSHGHR
jgi:hypothetical protein